MAQKPVLGKGLASLFTNAPPPNVGTTAPHSTTPVAGPQAATGATAAGPAGVAHEKVKSERHLGISMAAVDEIKANHYQPRREFDDVALQELAQSIKTSGIIQPLVVRKTAKDGFELIAGERRLRAAKLAGLKQVPIVIRRSTDKEALELALIENIQRRDLNCVDEALAYFQLIQDFALTQEEVADRVGKERATIANYLRLLRLPETILDDLKKGVLTFGHGKALLGIDDPHLRMQARALILEKSLSVRDTEALVESLKNQPQNGTPAKVEVPPASAVKSRLGQLSQDLTRQFSAKVEIKGNEKHGKIIIHYSTRQDLERILENMHTK